VDELKMVIARVKKRFTRVDLTVDSTIDEEYRQIIYSRGETAAGDYRKYQKSVVEEYRASKEEVESRSNIHISQKEIQETMDKWLIDAKLRTEDGTIEELRGVTKTTQHYTSAVNSFLYTHDKKKEEEKKNKALLDSTDTNKIIKKLLEENRLLKEREQQRQQEEDPEEEITTDDEAPKEEEVILN
jgi:hypothetical protein